MNRFNLKRMEYECQGRYLLKQVALEADIAPLNATTQKIVVNGKVIGILQDALMQITTNHENGEALLLQPGANEKQIKMREMIGAGDAKATVAGIGMKQVDFEGEF